MSNAGIGPAAPFFVVVALEDELVVPDPGVWLATPPV